MTHRQPSREKYDDPDVVKEIQVETPVGKLAAKGIRISDILTIIGTGISAFVLGVMLAHVADAKESWSQVTLAMSEHTKAIRAQTRAQNLTTCIMSVPMDRREKEFTDPNSFCRRVTALP
jgi:hypothetical protein